jgi:hypothetical protein
VDCDLKAADTLFGICSRIRRVNDLWADELHRLTEDKDNYIIDGMWKFPKKDAMPAKHSHNPDESGYSYCIWGGKARCFFFPSFS